MIQDHDQATDYEPARAVRVRKMIWDDTDRAFTTQYFVRVYCRDIMEISDTMAWLEQEFGPRRHQGTRWRHPGNSHWIWLQDNLATFWQLRWGQLL